jgi:molybdate transport system substrate-binding protein
MKLRVLLSILLLAALGACTQTRQTPPNRLTIMAASSLTGAFEEIGAQFEASHPGVELEYNFAGSQQLAQQISQGAAAGVFASANQEQMDITIHSGRADRRQVRIFARNQLVIIYPQDNPARIASAADLARPGIKLVVAAKEVPVGRYTLEFLERAASSPAYGAGFEQAVLGNVVSYEANVKGVLAKVALGEADAGVVYRSDVSADAGAGVRQVEIPAALNVIAAYPIAPLLDAPDAVLAQEFVDYVLAEPGQAVLLKYGFLPAK